MIIRNGKEISQIVQNGKFMVRVMYGLALVWEAIRSCFGKGYWIDEYPWIDEDVWSN